MATTLLFHRGLVQASADQPGQLHVGSIRSAAEFFANAPECAPEAVLTVATRTGITATMVPDPGNADMVRRNLLAPMFHMATSRGRCR